jgi:hypothetical protein
MKKTLIIIIVAVLGIAAVWFGTVWLQQPPDYPTIQSDIETYYKDFRMNYSINKAGLVQDVDALVAFTGELHADPYRSISKQAFLQKAEEVKRRIRTMIPEEISVWDAFYLLQELAAFLEDGHTTLFPLNWEKTADEVFPLTFTAIEGRIFVKDNFGENQVPIRAEILSVGGITIKRMINDVMKYVPGTLSHLKQARFAEQLGLFIQTYYKMPSPWQVTFKYQGSIVTTTVRGISRESAANLAAAREEFTESSCTVDGKTVPVLELNFSGWGDSEWDDFKAFIDDFFIRNSNKPYLIIDARYHLGGEGDWGYYVLSHLTPAPLKGYREFSFKVSPLHQRIVQYFLKENYYEMGLPQFLWGLPLYKMAEQDDPYYWIGRGILESGPGINYHAEWDHLKPFLADETSTRFQGKVFLLISHETFSAGVLFAGLFKSNNLGTIVGRETGGRIYMESDMRPVFLPCSKLMYLVPVAKLIVSDDCPDRGVMPDIAVELTASDYLNHTDKDMERVMDLIHSELTAANSDETEKH